MDCLTLVMDGYSADDVLLFIIMAATLAILMLVERAWWRE